ncbi:MAG: tripartite tricarboxylate transporter permease [Deltaproteobacteria bacterium]|nr:MAG: tripartite tricarboxylate transporter permease [Deltaproteobacteria bacterium]RLC17072.1 MAG: tripartite tricarboxylate transporter permease [Deltaproteobacteria bacterium]
MFSEIIPHLMHGFSVAFTFQGLAMVTIGCIVGTLIGALPGLGPITAIAVMIPMLSNFEPAFGMILMAGIYYGAIFGGSTSSILINAPGVAGVVATAFDGYPMTKKGQSGKALCIAAISSFSGGTLSVIGLMLLAPVMAKFALLFGPPEYFSLMVFAMFAVTAFSEGSTIKGLISAILGLMAATIGIDLSTGYFRYSMGLAELQDGIKFLVVILGLFALTEVFTLSVKKEKSEKDADYKHKVTSLKITKKEGKMIVGPICRGSVIGFLIGVLPGAGATIASFMSYAAEKKINKDPETFGKGDPRGLAAPEAANNAACSGSFIPLLTLGIPGSGSTAVMLGALMAVGVTPSPQLMTNYPDLFWGTIASMYTGMIILLIINLPMIPYFARVLWIPKPLLLPSVVLFSLIGIYGVGFSVFDLFLLVLFGVFGMVMKYIGIPPAPLILAFIIGPLLENSFGQSLTISQGGLWIFWDTAISKTFLVLIGIVIIRVIWKMVYSDTEES